MQEAIGHYEQALRIKPDYAEAHYNLGVALEQAGKRAGGDRALRAGAADQARLRRGALQSGGRLGASWAGCRRRSGIGSKRCGSSPITPRRTTIWESPWRRRAGLEEAIGHWEQALRIKPDYAEAHYNLGAVLAALGDASGAIAQYREALRLRPEWPPALSKLAWILATDRNETVRNGADAARLAERLCEVTGYRQAEALDVLAAAYAEAGRFGDAIRVAQKAIELASAAAQQELAQQVQERLKLYQASRPFHEGSEPTAPGP